MAKLSLVVEGLWKSRTRFTTEAPVTKRKDLGLTIRGRGKVSSIAREYEENISHDQHEEAASAHAELTMSWLSLDWAVGGGARTGNWEIH